LSIVAVAVPSAGTKTGVRETVDPGPTLGTEALKLEMVGGGTSETFTVVCAVVLTEKLPSEFVAVSV
jgi:hypothetical protein